MTRSTDSAWTGDACIGRESTRGEIVGGCSIIGRDACAFGIFISGIGDSGDWALVPPDLGMLGGVTSLVMVDDFVGVDRRVNPGLPSRDTEGMLLGAAGLADKSAGATFTFGLLLLPR